MLDRLPLNNDQRTLLGQVLRYGVTGGIVTAFGVGAYLVAVGWGNVVPLGANVIAYLVSMALGYFMHARFSFREQSGNASVQQGGKFFITSGISFALNSLFVWLFTDVMGWDERTPVIAMIFITPAICFVIYRKWVFA
jgi:putative flippase GtrA